MRLLVLGGTEFVGMAVVEAGLARGFDVTVFHRGRHPAPPEVAALHGDRTAPGGLAALAEAGGEWDVVVDTWSWAPAAVRDAARLLEPRAGHYVYVSSRSVYTFPVPPGATGLAEDAPVVDGSPDDAEDGGLAAYNRMKRGGELAALAAFGPGRTLLPRPGLVLGPGENIGRLPWWLTRIARGGRVLAPGPADLPFGYLDVRDLAGWLLDAAVAGVAGPFDLQSPPGHATTASVLSACVAATGSDAELVWTDPEPILAAGVRPWTQLPGWFAPGEYHAAFHLADVSRALAAGLRPRPVLDTVADTWTWLQKIGGRAPHRPDRPPVGLDPAVETAILDATQGRGASGARDPR